MQRSYLLGLAIGSLWLIVASLIFSTVILAFAQVPGTIVALAAVIIIGAALIALGIRVIRAAAKLPAQVATDRSTLRARFIVVVVVEVVAFAVVNTLCIATRKFNYIAPLDLIIVGVHFLPLARLFGVRRYYGLGIGFCLICVTTLLVVDPLSRTGALATWITLPTFGCSLLAVGVGLFGLREAWLRTAAAS